MKKGRWQKLFFKINLVQIGPKVSKMKYTKIILNDSPQSYQ